MICRQNSEMLAFLESMLETPSRKSVEAEPKFAENKPDSSLQESVSMQDKESAQRPRVVLGQRLTLLPTAAGTSYLAETQGRLTMCDPQGGPEAVWRSQAHMSRGRRP